MYVKSMWEDRSPGQGLEKYRILLQHGKSASLSYYVANSDDS